MLPGITPAHVLSAAGVAPGNDAFTQLLCHFEQPSNSLQFNDDSQNQMVAFAVGGGLTTTQSKFGSTALVCATNQYAAFQDRTFFNFGTGEWTIDFWFRFTTLPSAAFSTFQGSHLACRGNTNAGWSVGIGTMTGGFQMAYRFTSSTGLCPTAIPTANLTLNTWHHFAYVRDNSIAGNDGVRFFFNGALIGTVTFTDGLAWADTAVPLCLNSGASNSFTLGGVGQMDEFRLSVGKARWIAAFTPPTAPYTPNKTVDGNDPLTKLLLHGDGGAASQVFTDASASARGNATVTGNTQIHTTISKFGGNAIYFDGNGDYLTYPDHADFDFGSGDFTIDFWIYQHNLALQQVYFEQPTDANNYHSLSVLVNGTLDYRIVTAGSTVFSLASAAGTIVVTTWTHIALVRSGSTWKLYKDGVQVASATYAPAIPNYTLVPLWGAHTGGTLYLYANMDEFRLSKNIARWTAAFTPPGGPYATKGSPPTPPDIGTYSNIQYITTTGAGTLTTPANWNNADNSVECIGGGAGGSGGQGNISGANGGGGGAYSRSNNVTLSGSVPVNVGVGGAAGAVATIGTAGGDTWLGNASYASATVGAKGGTVGAARTDAIGNPGGDSAAGIGTIKYSGGRGGATPVQAGGGGGGAGGFYGKGGDGSKSSSGSSAGGGGGGGSSGGFDGSVSATSVGSDGGANHLWTGGGAGGAAAAGPGSAGTLGGGGGGGGNNLAGGGIGGTGSTSQIYDSTHGPGGGGGGGGGPNNGGNGGLYGAGGGGGGAYTLGSTGGNGAQGLIILRWNP